MLKFNTTKIDGGTVKYGEKVSFPIEVTNDSNREIVLNVQSTTCSCTTGSVSPNPIPPNTKAILTINFNSTKTNPGRDMLKQTRVNWFYDGTTFTELIDLKINSIRG